MRVFVRVEKRMSVEQLEIVKYNEHNDVSKNSEPAKHLARYIEHEFWKHTL